MTTIDLNLSQRRYERFVREYTVDRNVSAAYIRAGYVGNASNAKRLFETIEIQVAIAQIDCEVYHKIDLTVERIMEEYTKLAFAEMVDVYYPGTKVFLPLDEMPDNVRGAIESIELDEITGQITKLKLSNKKGALDSLAKIMNMFEGHQKAGSGEIKIVMDEKDLKA
tara:strand:- start:4302 stop:4802 length:501 start_codon:yes stop_codon:yes gene_type:complete